MLSIKSPRGLEDDPLCFRPPCDDISSSFFRLTIEKFALPQGTEFYLALTHVVGFTWAFGCGGDVLGGGHGVEGVLPDDFNIVGQ